MANLLAVLEKELMANRERYNTLFALAKRARPRLDQERFFSNLERFLAPLVSETTDALISPLYELTLELTGLELFQRSSAVTALWTELLPGAASRLVSQSGVTAASLTNAVYNLERESGVDWKFWLKQMEKCQNICPDSETWLKAGQVLSWVCGMAHYRDSAKALAESLPSELVETLVPRWDAVRNDPWWSRRPAPGRVAKVHKVGGFVGFGGEFRRPPEVVAAGPNQFIVSDGTDDWLLSCDGFGATLKRVVEFEMEDVEKSDISVCDGEIIWSGQKFPFPEISKIGTFDVAGQVLVCTGALSHHVHVFLGTAVG